MASRIYELSTLFGFSVEREDGRRNGQRPLAEFVNVDPKQVGRWFDGEYDPPSDVARRFGVSYDWLLGDASFMWSERVVNLRRSLKSYLRTIQAHSPSQRFVAVVEFLRSQAPDLVTDEYLSRVTRMTVDELRSVVAFDHEPGAERVTRLAEFCDIDATWFATGEASMLVDVGEWGKRLRDAGFDGDEIDALIVHKSHESPHSK